MWVRLAAHARYPVHILTHEPDQNARCAPFNISLAYENGCLVELVVLRPKTDLPKLAPHPLLKVGHDAVTLQAAVF